MALSLASKARPLPQSLSTIRAWGCGSGQPQSSVDCGAGGRCETACREVNRYSSASHLGSRARPKNIIQFIKFVQRRPRDPASRPASGDLLAALSPSWRAAPHVPGMSLRAYARARIRVAFCFPVLQSYSAKGQLYRDSCRPAKSFFI